MRIIASPKRIVTVLPLFSSRNFENRVYGHTIVVWTCFWFIFKDLGTQLTSVPAAKEVAV